MELTDDTQEIYIHGLADLRMELLATALQTAVRECKFFPTIAEIRAFADKIPVDLVRIEEAYERRKQAILAAPEPKQLKSALDEPKPGPYKVTQLSEEEHNERVKILRRQLDSLKVED